MARAGMTSIVHCHLSTDPAGLIVAAEQVARAAQDVGVRVAFVVPLRDRNRLGYGADEAILAHMEPGDIGASSARPAGRYSSRRFRDAHRSHDDTDHGSLARRMSPAAPRGVAGGNPTGA